MGKANPPDGSNEFGTDIAAHNGIWAAVIFLGDRSESSLVPLCIGQICFSHQTLTGGAVALIP